MSSELNIEVHVGKHFLSYVDFLSQLRIDTFKEYPYLYEGNLEIESKHIRDFISDEKSMVVVAKVSNEIAGICTGTPLSNNSEIISKLKKASQKKALELDGYYYCAELIVLPKFRGIGLTRKLLEIQDKKIAEWGFKSTCLLTIVRDTHHPLKPIEYKPTDEIWEKMGFHKTDLMISQDWPTIQADRSVKNAENILQFWEKDICETRLAD